MKTNITETDGKYTVTLEGELDTAHYNAGVHAYLPLLIFQEKFV